MPSLVLICLACGATLPPALAEAGSLRCHDCRAAHAPLQTVHVARQRTAYDAVALSEAA